MRFFLTVSFLLLLITSSVAQNSGRRGRSSVYSASGEWQKVTLQPNTSASSSQPVNSTVTPSRQATNSASQPAEPTATTSRTESRPSTTTESSSAGFRPAFTGDFVTNRNGWKAGNKGDYNYQIGMGRYSVRKRKANSRQVAFSFVPLPNEINLNRDETFTIKVDVLADSGRVPTGGLLFGVKDSLNFCAFTLNSKGEVSIIRVIKGEAFGDYMPGDFFAPGVPVDKNRDRLTIRRSQDALSFYVNEQEVRSSPYPFKSLPGNGIGVITDASWTTFQKLTVTVGVLPGDSPPTAPSFPVARSTTAERSATPTASTNENSDVTPAPVNSSAPKETTPSPSTISAAAGNRPVTKTGNVVFNESFTDNQNKWLVGQTGGYEFEVAKNSYYIRKRSMGIPRAAYGYVTLPPTVDLNKMESFTITADMVVPEGIQLNAGLIIGVDDEDNLCEFRLAGREKVIVKMLRNGATSATYMPGNPVLAKVRIDQESNTLMIQKRNKKLHFFINNREIESSPYDFQPFLGNKIGFVTATQAVKFQNLKVIQ
ncbi:hypothetical protein GCM10028807_38450 [Spirosoma daeguense]